MSERSAEEIATLLVQTYRARLPEPEELLGSEAAAPQHGPRPGFEGSQWFRANIGRNQNADPRWILPLLCKRGHVGRGDIGAIRITANETLFEITAGVASSFLTAVKRSAVAEDDGLEIIAVEGSPREESRHNRRDNARPAPHGAKPHRPGNGKPGGFKGPGAGPGKKGPYRPNRDRPR
jgi:ATP-dependent RNA helicase DeaD